MKKEYRDPEVIELEQSGLSTTGGHSVRAVVNVHVVNSERWLHLWFLVRCRVQCAVNNSSVSVVRLRCKETKRNGHKYTAVNLSTITGGVLTCGTAIDDNILHHI